MTSGTESPVTTPTPIEPSSSAELVQVDDGWIASAQQGDTRFRFHGATAEEALLLLRQHLESKKAD